MGRRTAQIIAISVVVAGAVFALQGLSVLPSRIMYGRPEWIVIGTAMVVVGGIALERLRGR